MPWPYILAGLFVLFTTVTLWIGLSPKCHRQRRLLLSRWRRLTVWEFWPLWMFYPPVILYIIYLGLRHRSMTLFTAANPAMPAGGFIGEEKSKILSDLAAQDDKRLARWQLIPHSPNIEEQIAQLEEFLRKNDLDFPVVLKPNEGQRGLGVSIIHTAEQGRAYLQKAIVDTLIQEYVPGHEFGVFYFRFPGETTGSVFSITTKILPELTGDGRRTIERLILDDDRAVCMAPTYLKWFRKRLSEVPESGKRLPIAELGTHSLGALFLDGGHLNSPALVAAMDSVSKPYEGFYFGRFDIKAPTPEAFREGREIKVLEVNGVTSEATHIYDPKYSLFYAYKTLFEQWRIAFAIGAANRKRGALPVSIGTLLTHSLTVARRQKKIAKASNRR